MRLGVISDVHANFEALRSLEDDLADVDQVLCLGDIVGYYCQPKEVIAYLRDIDALCILGNHDHFVLRGCPPSLPNAVKFGVEFASRVIDDEERDWLASLPMLWGGTLGDQTLLLAHGSPWNPMGDYLFPDNPRLDSLNEFGFDALLFGQTHRPFLRLDSRPALVNPGSVGQPRDTASMASMVVLDTGTLDVVSIRRPFDPIPVIDLARANGAGDWIAKHLL